MNFELCFALLQVINELSKTISFKLIVHNFVRVYEFYLAIQFFKYSYFIADLTAMY